VFIEAKDGGSDGDSWRYRSCKAPVKSSPPTNRHQVFFYRPDALPVAQPTVSKHWREKYHIPWTCLPQSHLDVFQLCLFPLIAPGYLGEGCHAVSPLMPVPIMLPYLVCSFCNELQLYVGYLCFLSQHLLTIMKHWIVNSHVFSYYFAVNVTVIIIISFVIIKQKLLMLPCFDSGRRGRSCLASCLMPKISRTLSATSCTSSGLSCLPCLLQS